ncbi:MAG: hypothetical protein FWF61_03865, partial [Brevinematales bacterium]|nr:hypothetical protein [Brevinematales bacterium]
MMLPQIRNLIIGIGENIIGRELKDHDKWMKELFRYLIFVIFFFICLLIFLFQKTLMQIIKNTDIRYIASIEHGVNFFLICIISMIFFAAFAVSVNQITGFSLSKFLPGYSDMADYYIEINAAVKKGIFSHNAGYNGYIWHPDILSIADNLFYGAHGLFILLPYVFTAKVIGWNGITPLIIHMILLTIAFLFVYFSTRSFKKAFISQIVTFTFIPFLIYFPTTMMEIQMYAWGIVLMALIYAYINHPSKINHIGLLVCVLFASTARITNIVYIIPYFILIIDKNCLHKKLKLMMGLFTVACVLILYLVNIRLSAPYPSSFVSRFSFELRQINNWGGGGG